MDLPSISSMRVALVHDWLVQPGGAERVLAALHRAFPRAVLFTLFCREATVQGVGFEPNAVQTSFLQRMPGILTHHTAYLPLYPLAVESLNVKDFDLVVSSSHSVAKGVLPTPDQRHLCYCHTPMRYAWHMASDYLRLYGLEHGLRQWPARVGLHYVRNWDAASTSRVDRFVANSVATAARIRRYYGRESTVLHPPVDVTRFRPSKHKGEFFLFASRLVPYKRADLAVRVFSRLGLPLWVAGSGPAQAECRKLAGSNVRFLGQVRDEDMPDLLAKARALVFPGNEDFGIVIVEAQAAGTPVIALGTGGALDTVVPARGGNWHEATGILFAEQSVSGLEEAVQRFLAQEDQFSKTVLVQNAARFTPDRFIAGMHAAAEDLMNWPASSVAVAHQ